MTHLQRVLRTPHTPVLLERRAAQALVDQAFEENADRQSGGWLRSLLGRGAPAQGERDGARLEDINRDVLAMPRVPWASAIEEGEGYAIVDGIAVIDVRGVLTPSGYYDWWEDCWRGGYAQIGSALKVARGDDRVRGIFLRVESPGGLVDGCFELANEIREGRALAGGKPIWTHTKLACSAAYAIACSTDRIVATRSADVGSIGVVVLHIDMSEMMAEWGLKVEAIQSAARKTIGASWKPLAKEDREHFQAIVDEIARWFVALVESGRGLSAEAIRAQEALWYIAEHSEPERSGLALGLVDAIDQERAAFDALQESLSTSTATGAPAGAGVNATDLVARANQKKDPEMSLTEQIAALRAKAAKGDAAAAAELKALGISLKAAENDDDDEAAEGEDDEEQMAEDDEEEEEAAEGEDDEEKEPAARATGSKAGFALLDAKEARGRDALARQLAGKVAAKKLNYGEARKMLASAPKSSRLSERMAGRDIDPGTESAATRSAGASGWKKAVAKQNARVSARR